MAQPLDSLTDALLAAARSAGADAADAIAVTGSSVSVDVRGGALEHAERSEGIDLGLRVMLGQRQACVSSSDISSDTIAEMAARAVAMAREAPEDPGVRQAGQGEYAADTDMSRLEMADPAPEPEPAELEEAARRAEAAALSHERISTVESASAAHGRRHVHLATSAGFSAGYSRTESSLSCIAITGTGTGMERDYCGEQRLWRADLPTPEEVGHLAAERTAARAGAKKPPTGRYPVLFDERVAGSLIGHLVSAANGTAIVRGASWLSEAMGEPVLPEGISLVEEPHRPRASASRLFDGEGMPTRTLPLVEDGRLVRWVLDLATAQRLGLESTANAARGASAPPAPAAGNLRLTQGADSRDSLIAGMGTGLIVTSFIGATINPTTGDYSRGASGFWVEGGQIAYPVYECTIAGNLRNMLRRILPANDARPHLSRQVPSVLIEGLTLAGA